MFHGINHRVLRFTMAALASGCAVDVGDTGVEPPDTEELATAPEALCAAGCGHDCSGGCTGADACPCALRPLGQGEDEESLRTGRGLGAKDGFLGAPGYGYPGALPYGGYPFGGAQLGAPPYGGYPFGGAQPGTPPFGGYPYGGYPFGGAQLGASPYGGYPFGGAQLGAPPYGGYPFGGVQPGAPPYGGYPYGKYPFGGSPFLGWPGK